MVRSQIVSVPYGPVTALPWAVHWMSMVVFCGMQPISAVDPFGPARRLRHGEIRMRPVGCGAEHDGATGPLVPV